MSDDSGGRLESALRMTAAGRLLALGIPPYAITRWCDAWEVEAKRRGLEVGAASWDDGIRWIVGKVAAGQGPPG